MSWTKFEETYIKHSYLSGLPTKIIL